MESCIRTVPDIFRIADQEMKRRYPEDQRPHRAPRILPMETIQSNPNIRGPLSVTQEYTDNWNRSKAEEKQKKHHDYERDLIKKLAERERLRSKLTELDPSKKKQSRKIAAFNVQLKNLESSIKQIQKDSGINMDTLDYGTKLGRFWSKLKKKGKKLLKKIKKFYKDNQGLIEGVLAVVIPIVGSLLCKKILGF